MQKLILHASALAGLLIFLKQAWTYAPLDRALLTAISTGLGIYLVLFLGAVLVRHIAAQAPAEPEPTESDTEADSSAASEDNASEPPTESTGTSPSATDEPEPADPVAAPVA